MSPPLRRRPVVAVLAAAVLGTLAAGCASIPSSSRPQVISESIPASPPSGDGDPRFDPIVPQRGQRPEEIVRDYIAVGGSLEHKHARARAYLTESSARTWDDNDGAIVLEDFYLDVRGGGAKVSMRAQRRGRLDADGTYLPDAAPYQYTFDLEKNADGQWRIANPPPGVFIGAATFEDVYRPYNAYFLDSTRTRVVPDVRWFVAPQDSLPSLLVSALERGPSESLRGAVRSDLEGAKLESNVVRESDRVRVYLTGLADRSDPLPPGGFAQLVWTLNQFGVGGVEIYSDGQLLQRRGAGEQTLQRLSDWRVFDPDALSATAPGYFVRDGAVWTTANSAAPGPAGQAGYAARAVAVSTDQRWMAVVGRGAGGRPTLFVGPARGRLRPTVNGASLTPPSWGAAADEVWTVRNGRDVVLVPTSGEATRVVVPALDQIGPVRALRLSRDGTRVALVAGPAGRERPYIGVVRRENGAVRVDNPLELDVGEGPVSDVSWSTALDLVALVRGGEQDSALYALRIDGVTTGRLVSTWGLPGPPSAVAAAPALPLLTIAAGDVWRTLASNERWTRVARDASPHSTLAYPG